MSGGVRVLWLGSQPCKDGPRALTAAGFLVEMRPWTTVAANETPDVVVVSLDDRVGPSVVLDIPLKPPAAKIIALTARQGDVIASLAAGAHDALRVPEACAELTTRVLVWSRQAAQERQQRASVAALVERT